MESIARTKPNMSVLPGDILPVSPFGILSQAFTEEVLGRFESGPGMYPMYGLELLYPEVENGNETPSGGNIHLEVQLKLILQHLKESGKTPAAERILKKAETLRLLREKTVVRQTPGAAGKAAAGRMPAAVDRTLSSRGLMPWPGAAGSSGRTAPGQSGAGRMAALTGTGRAGGGSYWPGMHAAPAAGMGYRQPETHIGAVDSRGYRRPGTYTGAAANGHNWPPGIYAAPMAGAGNDQPGTPVKAERPARTKSLGTLRTGGEDTQVSLREKALWSQQAQTVPVRPAVWRGAALTGMGSPTVAGLPGQMGQSLAEARFLTPQEAGASGGKRMDREKPAAGLVRRMEQAAAQAAEAVARMMAMEPQGTQAGNHHQHAGRSPSNTERKLQGSDRLRVEQAHWGAEKDAPGNESGVAVNHMSTGMTTDHASGGTAANHGFAGAMAGDGEASGGHSSAKVRTDSGTGVGRIGSTARDIRTSGGGQMSSLPDTEWTTGGAAGAEPALRQDKIPSVEEIAAASGCLPLSLEHMEPAAIWEQAIIPGRIASVDGAGRRFAQAIEAAALGAEGALAQSARDSRREERPAAERKSKARDEAAPMKAKAATAFASQAAGAADADGRLPVRMKRSTALAKGAEEAVESTAPFDRQDWPAVIQPAADHAMASRMAVGPLTAGRLPDHLPATGHPAANGPGVLRDLEKWAIGSAAAGSANTRFETGGGLTVDGSISAELAGQPPLTLEYLQELQKDDIQAPERIQALPPKALEKLLDTPGLRLLGRDMAVLAAEGREGRQAPHRRSQAAGRTAGPMAQAGGTVNGGTAHRGMSSAAGDVAPAKPSPVGYGDFSQGVRLCGFPRSQNMSLPSVRPSSALAAGGMALPGAAPAAQSHTWSPTHAGRRGFPAGGPGQVSAVGRMGGLSRGRGTGSAAPGAAASGGAAFEGLSAYPALSMEYGGPLAAAARELRQTAEREISRIGGVRDMGLHTPAARAGGEKGAPESIQTLELMTQPQIQAQQMVWENPYMRSAPAEMAHHRKNDPKNQQRTQQSQPQLRMSDAELRRAADKVFKLVQEKIISERRRIGRM